MNYRRTKKNCKWETAQERPVDKTNGDGIGGGGWGGGGVGEVGGDLNQFTCAKPSYKHIGLLPRLWNIQVKHI